MMTPGQYATLDPQQKIIADLLVELIRQMKRIADAAEKEPNFE